MAKVTSYDTRGNRTEAVAPAIHAAGQALKAATLRLNGKYGKSQFVLGWHEIRELLYRSLPEGIVLFDKQVFPLKSLAQV